MSHKWNSPLSTPLGAFYLVALDEDWDIRPENLNQQNQVRPRPLFSQPLMYAANAAGAAIASYNIKAVQYLQAKETYF